jgi:hypothetical protein
LALASCQIIAADAAHPVALLRSVDRDPQNLADQCAGRFQGNPSLSAACHGGVVGSPD